MAVRIPIFLVAAVLAGRRAHAADGWTPLRHDRYGSGSITQALFFNFTVRPKLGTASVCCQTTVRPGFWLAPFANQEGYSPAVYQRYLAERSYSSFPVTYAPRGQSWFGLSGERDRRIYYEKVMFSCGNGVITSFAIAYPPAQRDRLDALSNASKTRFDPDRGASDMPAKPIREPFIWQSAAPGRFSVRALTVTALCMACAYAGYLALRPPADAPEPAAVSAKKTASAPADVDRATVSRGGDTLWPSTNRHADMPRVVLVNPNAAEKAKEVEHAATPSSATIDSHHVGKRKQRKVASFTRPS